MQEGRVVKVAGVAAVHTRLRRLQLEGGPKRGDRRRAICLRRNWQFEYLAESQLRCAYRGLARRVGCSPRGGWGHAGGMAEEGKPVLPAKRRPRPQRRKRIGGAWDTNRAEVLTRHIRGREDYEKVKLAAEKPRRRK